MSKENTPAERIHAYIARTGKRDPEAIRAALRKTGSLPMATIRAVLAEQPPAAPLPAPARAITLSNVRVAHAKPNEGLKSRFYRLQKGKGYPLAALATEWCVTEETIRNQAKRLDCLKYVETSPGEWIPCILHPDTATSYAQ